MQMASSPGMLLFEYLLYRRLLRAALFSFMWREARHVSGVPDLPRVYFVPKEGLQNTFTFGHYDTTLYTNPFLILHGIKQGGPKTLSEAKQKLITWISCCCKVLKNKQFHMKVILRLPFDVITYKCLSSTGKKKPAWFVLRNKLHYISASTAHFTCHNLSGVLAMV